MLRSKIATSISILALAGTLCLPRLALADGPVFLGGDIFTATNNTTGNGTWSDPVSANPGEVIEFRIVAQNQDPSQTAHNVLVKASLPQTLGTSDVATTTITSQEGSSVSDNVTVNILGGSQQEFGDVVPGHTRLFGNACPSGCTIDDAVTTSGINVGDLAPGQSVQILFKAWISNIVSASPTPTPTPTSTPAPTPTATPAVGGGQIQIQGQTQTQNNNQTVNITTAAAPTAAPTAAPQVVSKVTTPVKQLPETGLPLAGLALGGLLPAGLKMRKFGKDNSDGGVSANTLWEEKQLKS